MNPLFIAYIVLIETITPPSGCKLFYCVSMSQFPEAVGSNGLPQHTQFPYALASFSRFVKHCCYVAFRKCIVWQTVTSSDRRFDLRSGRSYPSLSAFASTPMLSVLLGAGSSPCILYLTSATGLVNPAIFRRWRFALGVFLALRSDLILLKFFRSHLPAAALARGNSRTPIR